MDFANINLGNAVEFLESAMRTTESQQRDDPPSQTQLCKLHSSGDEMKQT
jgi:hypothetical protein